MAFFIAMKIEFISYILVILFLVSCSKDIRDYRMEEVYKDYYVQKKIDDGLTLKEHDLLDRAEERYTKKGLKHKFAKMTIREIIEEQVKNSGSANIQNIIIITVKKYSIIDKDNEQFLEWTLQLRNKSQKDIIKIQGWLNFIDIKSKEILRTDALDCNIFLAKDSTLEFKTMPFFFDTDEQANQIIKKATIKDINKMLQWQPTLFLFSDSSEISNQLN